MIAAAVIPIAGADLTGRAELAAFLAILVGVLMIVGGLTGFAFITDLLSLPVRIGYLIGIAFTVIVSQLPKLLGYEFTGSGLIDELRAIPGGIADADALTVAIGGASLALILGVKARAPKVPGGADRSRRLDGHRGRVRARRSAADRRQPAAGVAVAGPPESR